MSGPVLELAPGQLVADCWTVERLLGERAGVAALLARGPGNGQAIVLFLPEGAPEPSLDVDQEALWGTVRRVRRDPQWGRCVVDELPAGGLLSERIAERAADAATIVDQLRKRLKIAHQRGWAHGSLDPECVIGAAEGIAVAGWGIAGGSTPELVSRDQAAYAAIAAAAGVVSDEVTGVVSPDSPPAGAADTAPLRAAILSDHAATLEQAVTRWASQGGDPSHQDAVRAQDALGRIQRKVDAHLAQASSLIARGDPLGAVAACREAIRLGAEERADPILREARRQAKRMVTAPRLPSWRVLAAAAAGAGAVLLLIAAAVTALRPSPDAVALRTRVESIAATRGERAAVRTLLGDAQLSAENETGPALLSEHLTAMVVAERERLIALKDDAIRRGARPEGADLAAREALAGLEAAIGTRPIRVDRLDDAFGALDRAAAEFRASTGVSPTEAAHAVETLLAEDPVFRAGSPDGARKGGR